MNKQARIIKAMKGKKWWKPCDVHMSAGFSGYTDTTRRDMHKMAANGQLITRKQLGKECNRWLTEFARGKK